MLAGQCSGCILGALGYQRNCLGVVIWGDEREGKGMEPVIFHFRPFCSLKIFYHVNVLLL